MLHNVNVQQNRKAGWRQGMEKAGTLAEDFRISNPRKPSYLLDIVLPQHLVMAHYNVLPFHRLKTILK